MSLVKQIREAILRGFSALPLLLIGWVFFMGSATGNIGLLVLALGHIFAVPLVTVLSNLVVDFANSSLSGLIGDWAPLLTVANKDLCNIIPSATDYTVGNLWVAPSYWMAQITFFFAFLITNGFYVYTMESDPNADKEKVERRKSQALLSMILSSALFVVLAVTRKLYTGCETFLGMFLGIAVSGAAGYGWYELARLCAARDADIFGIIQKILPPSASDPPPMTCVYKGP